LPGQFFKLLAALNGLGQSGRPIGRDAPGQIAAFLSNLMLEIRPSALVGVSLRGPGLGLKRAAFHTVDLLHLLEDLAAFMCKRIIHVRKYA
jgi:hypothetical protein